MPLGRTRVFPHPKGHDGDMSDLRGMVEANPDSRDKDKQRIISRLFVVLFLQSIRVDYF